MKTENDNRQEKLNRYCNVEKCIVYSNVSRMQAKLRFHSQQKQEYLLGFIKTDKAKAKGWVEYICPNCGTVTRFMYDEKKDDWV